MLPITPDSFQHGTKMAIWLSGRIDARRRWLGDGAGTAGVVQEQDRQRNQIVQPAQQQRDRQGAESIDPECMHSELRDECARRAADLCTEFLRFFASSSTSQLERNPFRVDILYPVDSGTRGRCCPSQPLYTVGTRFAAGCANCRGCGKSREPTHCGAICGPCSSAGERRRRSRPDFRTFFSGDHAAKSGRQRGRFRIVAQVGYPQS